MTAERIGQIMDGNAGQRRNDAGRQQSQLQLGRSNIAKGVHDGPPKKSEEQRETDKPNLDQHNQIIVVHNRHPMETASGLKSRYSTSNGVLITARRATIARHRVNTCFEISRDQRAIRKNSPLLQTNPIIPDREKVITSPTQPANNINPNTMRSRARRAVIRQARTVGRMYSK